MTKNDFNLPATPVRWAGVILGLTLLTACRTPDLRPFDTSLTGWSLTSGQAVWRPDAASPGIAGEIILATHPSGLVLIDFSKGALPVAVIQLTPEAWRLEIPAQDRRYGGGGLPPARSAWLVLGRDQAGYPPPPYWTFDASEPGRTVLQSSTTGESLTLFLEPPP